MSGATGCRHFVDELGNYIGSWVGVEPPPGSVQVPDGPRLEGQTWNGAEWVGLENVLERENILAELRTLDGTLPRYVEHTVIEADNYLWPIRQKKEALRVRLQEVVR